MARIRTTTVKVSLEDIETITWALYRLNKATLTQDQLDNIARLMDRLERAEGRVS